MMYLVIFALTCAAAATVLELTMAAAVFAYLGDILFVMSTVETQR